MRERGIRAKFARRYRPTTTQSRHPHAVAPNVLDRDFAADGPIRKWLCDITYIPTDEGFLYLAGVMDAWSRDEARREVLEWIEVWYQRIRIHSSLGYLSPEAFETAAKVG